MIFNSIYSELRRRDGNRLRIIILKKTLDLFYFISLFIIFCYLFSDSLANMPPTRNSTIEYDDIIKLEASVKKLKRKKKKCC